MNIWIPIHISAPFKAQLHNISFICMYPTLKNLITQTSLRHGRFHTYKYGTVLFFSHYSIHSDIIPSQCVSPFHFSKLAQRTQIIAQSLRFIQKILKSRIINRIMQPFRQLAQGVRLAMQLCRKFQKTSTIPIKMLSICHVPELRYTKYPKKHPVIVPPNPPQYQHKLFPNPMAARAPQKKNTMPSARTRTQDARLNPNLAPLNKPRSKHPHIVNLMWMTKKEIKKPDLKFNNPYSITKEYPSEPYSQSPKIGSSLKGKIPKPILDTRKKVKPKPKRIAVRLSNLILTQQIQRVGLWQRSKNVPNQRRLIVCVNRENSHSLSLHFVLHLSADPRSLSPTTTTSKTSRPGPLLPSTCRIQSPKITASPIPNINTAVPYAKSPSLVARCLHSKVLVLHV